MYAVIYVDRYDIHTLVGVFDSEEKVLEAVASVYRIEETPFLKNELRANYYEDWFKVTVDEITINENYLTY